MSQTQTPPSKAGPASSDRIRVRREWVGAPAGTLTNPTVWLAVCVVVVFGATTWAYLASTLPAIATIAINSVAIYARFTVMHESMHGVAHSNRRVNAWIGRPMGMLLSISAPMFRGAHYEHHSHTNDPGRDPDLFLAKSPMWLLPIWTLAVTVEYRRHFYGRKLWRNRAELTEALTMEAVFSLAIVAAVATGNFTTLAVVWLVPALFAVMFLAITFDYLPHYPYDSRERYLDTRVYPGRTAFVVLLGQNYHLIHHLWTTVPWFRYPTVFRAIRPELEARGARIGWKVEPREVSVDTSAPPYAASA
jgi:beta-carotene hydroxylase